MCSPGACRLKDELIFCMGLFFFRFPMLEKMGQDEVEVCSYWGKLAFEERSIHQAFL